MRTFTLMIVPIGLIITFSSLALAVWLDSSEFKANRHLGPEWSQNAAISAPSSHNPRTKYSESLNQLERKYDIFEKKVVELGENNNLH